MRNDFKELLCLGSALTFSSDELSWKMYMSGFCDLRLGCLLLLARIAVVSADSNRSDLSRTMMQPSSVQYDRRVACGGGAGNSGGRGF